MKKQEKTATIKTTKKSTVKKVEKKVSRKSNRIVKRPSIFSVVFLAAIFIVITLIVIGARYLWLTMEYKEYKEKMDWYGLNVLYNNGSSNSAGKVTKSEMVKVIVGAVKNQTNVDYVNYVDKTTYDNEAWVDYAKMFKLIGEDKITSKNEDSRAKNLDATLAITKAVNFVLEKNIAVANVKYRNLNEFSDVDKTALGQAITLGLLKNKKGRIYSDNLTKGELNKMVIEIVEKYSTIYYDNKNTGASIVTDKEKLPSNYKDYPYIVDNIDKEVYEMPLINNDKTAFVTPKDMYAKRGNIYGQIDNTVKEYFDGILNIDYTTISEKAFKEKIGDLTIYLLKDEDVATYVKYVKDNKIKLEGSATPLLPILYNNGDQNTLRVKVTFKVLNSETDKNLLFGDKINFKTVTYNDDEFTFYIDMPLGITLNSDSLRVYTKSIATLVISKNVAIEVKD